MKGLLLKDIYMTGKYMKSILLLVVVFIAVALFGEGSDFFLFFPCLLAGVVPLSLQSYDESFKWTQYSAGLPCRRSQIVSVKYIYGLVLSAVMVILMSAVHAVVKIRGGESMNDTAVFAACMLGVSLIAPALSLPFIFKLGAEKGRIAYLVVVAVISGLATFSFKSDTLPMGNTGDFPFVLFIAAVLIVFVLSWLISIRVYNNREL
ncbi:MAG: ABC-2 transporter permease [Oscillospiraceae bacterium]|nr:ABC-2 transporter permease [Oscillospiraceae bacterium]